MTDNTNAKMLAMQKEHGPLLEVKDSGHRLHH